MDRQIFFQPDAQCLVELPARLQDVALTPARNCDVPVRTGRAEKFRSLHKTGIGIVEMPAGPGGSCFSQQSRRALAGRRPRLFSPSTLAIRNPVSPAGSATSWTANQKQLEGMCPCAATA